MDIACDACCLINFLAGDNIFSPPISPGFAKSVQVGRLFIPSEVARESLYLLQPDPNSPDDLIKTPIDLTSHFGKKILHQCTIDTKEEKDLFVRLAIDVDDGEAACLAIAKLRDFTVATDDRLAGRIAKELSIPVINTPQYVQRWAESIGASQDQIVSTIRNIERFARFSPRRDSPEAEWWIELAHH
jgi:hypothetical protein